MTVCGTDRRNTLAERLAAERLAAGCIPDRCAFAAQASLSGYSTKFVHLDVVTGAQREFCTFNLSEIRTTVLPDDVLDWLVSLHSKPEKPAVEPEPEVWSIMRGERW